MKKLIGIISVILSISIYCQDSTTHKMKLTASSDSVGKVVIINDISFLEKYQGIIGAIIGSSLAALIAIYSIRKTSKNQIDLENEKIFHNRYQSEKVYCGFWFSVHSVLLNHQQLLLSLRRELDAVLENAKHSGKIAYEKPYTYLAVDLIKECLMKILAYENYDSKNVLFLISYLNFVENLYNDLNFLPLMKVKNEGIEEANYIKMVDQYFIALFGKMDVIKDMNEKLLKDITDELEKSETNNVIV